MRFLFQGIIIFISFATFTLSKHFRHPQADRYNGSDGESHRNDVYDSSASSDSLYGSDSNDSEHRDERTDSLTESEKNHWSNGSKADCDNEGSDGWFINDGSNQDNDGYDGSQSYGSAPYRDDENELYPHDGSQGMADNDGSDGFVIVDGSESNENDDSDSSIDMKNDERTKKPKQSIRKNKQKNKN